MEPDFFDIARDALIGFVAGAKGLTGTCHTTAHGRGVKAWFDDDTREHYEAQLIRVDGVVQLEIGFHAEHPKAPLNDKALQQLLAVEPAWRKALGKEAVAGDFIGRAGWRRISEVWPAPGSDADADDPMSDVDQAIEAAARLADYIIAIEPLRRAR